MKLKTLVLSVAILLVLSAAAYWANRPPAPASADPRVGQPLADPASIAQASQVRLSDGGKTVLLTRQSDGTWRVPGYFGLTADFSKLSTFVSDLTAARIQRLVTVNPDRISRLEFKDTKIELLADGGRTLWSITLGKSADAGGRFARFGDESRAYLASLNASIEADPKAWADATLFTLKPDDVARIEIPFDPAAPVSVSREKKDSSWTTDRTPAGQKPSADKISSLLNTLGSLRFSDTSDPADALAAAARAHVRTFQLTTFAGQTYRVALGRKPEERKPKPPAAPKPEAKSAAPAADATIPATTPAPGPDTIAVEAGPVYAFITSSDAKSPVNALMQKRAFQIDDYVFTSLPQKPDDLFEPAPPPSSSSPPAAK